MCFRENNRHDPLLTRAKRGAKNVHIRIKETLRFLRYIKDELVLDEEEEDETCVLNGGRKGEKGEARRNGGM